MDFNEVAAVSGKGGLFKVVSPTRTGVILEALDGSGRKLLPISRLRFPFYQISHIYTTDEEGAVPLQDVLRKIHVEFKGDTGLTSSSDPDELKSFLKFILPEYDESRVYVSDIKKLVTWYNTMAKTLPELLEKKEEQEQAEEKPAEKEKKAAAPKAKKGGS